MREDVNSSSIHYNPRRGAAQKCISIRKDEQTVVHSCNEIPLSHKKEWTIDAYSDVDESQNQYAEWEKLDRKDYIPYVAIYMRS